jgi:hypothetical protein
VLERLKTATLDIVLESMIGLVWFVEIDFEIREWIVQGRKFESVHELPNRVSQTLIA